MLKQVLDKNEAGKDQLARLKPPCAVCVMNSDTSVCHRWLHKSCRSPVANWALLPWCLGEEAFWTEQFLDLGEETSL